MSADADKNTACPNVSEKKVIAEVNVRTETDKSTDDKLDVSENEKKLVRKVCFPDDDQLVTQYFEPANPWQDVPSTTRAQLAAEYLECCRRHGTPPIDVVLQQIRELPENAIGGGTRAPRLCLSECQLLGAAPVDALEALLRKVQFKRLELDNTAIDDEGAEAIYDMIEYYESAVTVCISGPRQYGIRGWQAASRMIKKSSELSELEVTDSALETSHAPVLARALRAHTCRLRALCLHRTSLAGEPLLCLVIALKSNNSIRELRLGDNRLTAADAAQLASLLRFNTNLQLLDLSNNQIQDAGVMHIADALSEQAAQTPPSAATSPISPQNCPIIGGYDMRGLAFLVLWNNQLTRNCANHLSKAVRSSQSLCVLNIGRNALGTDTVRALQAGSALISLGLQAARLGPEASKAIADLIRANTQLQRLDLRDNKLGAAGLQTILTAMKDNTTLTQIDLDDPVEPSLLSSDGESATVARLVREIRSCCRRNEPLATSPARRVHRKISLTCHTARLQPAPLPTGPTLAEEEKRGGRLRSPAPSPAPSPAGSPVPHSRFQVTMVTPERESSTESSSPSTPVRPTFCGTPSRFKVVQVMETPKIKVQQVNSEPSRRTSSRFSVTRNYDSMYNPTLTPSPPPVQTRLSTEPLIVTSTKFKDSSSKSTDSSSESIESSDISTETSPKNSQLSYCSTESSPEVNEFSNKSTKACPKVLDMSNSSSDSSPKVTEFGNNSIEFCNNSIESSPKFLEFINDSAEYNDTVNQFGNSSCDSNPEFTEFSDISNEFNPKSSVGFKITDLVNNMNCPKTNLPQNTQELNTSSASPSVDISIVKTGERVDDDLKNDQINVRTDVCLENNLNDAKSYVNDVNSDINKTFVNTCSVSDNSKVSDLNQSYKDVCEEATYNEDICEIDGDKLLKTETKLVKNSKEVCEKEVVDVNLEVTIKRESVQSNLNMQLPAKVHCDQNDCKDVCKEFIVDNNVNINLSSSENGTAMKQIEAITEDLGNLIQEMKDLSFKNAVTKKIDVKVKTDCTQTDVINVNNKLVTCNDVPVKFIRDNVVLKKNKSESSLDSPDLEVSRLMNKKMVESPFCDSSSSLEISGSSMESLNALDNQNTTPIICRPIIIQESIESDLELDRRKFDHFVLSTESSLESNTSETLPVISSNFLNTSVSSNDSVSPIIFGNKRIHGSLSSLEASVSSLESARQEKIMVTSADSGIEYSLQNPAEFKEDYSSNEGTLTNKSSLKEAIKKSDNFQPQETLTSCPKRTSSLLDVPALKTKGLERMRKISWVAPSPSFHIPKPEPEPTKLPSHLEKLLSLFQHPTSLFSRSSSATDEERKSASSTPPRKDSSLTSSFWSWGSSTEKVEKECSGKVEDRESSSEATDSTLSERVQVSFVDESFSKKLDSKSPSTDTDNTLSEFQSFPTQGNSETSEVFQVVDSKIDKVTELTTDDNLVQKTLDLSLRSIDNASSNGNKHVPRACDTLDLFKPNDLNKNVYDILTGDSNRIPGQCSILGIAETADKSELKFVDIKSGDIKPTEPVRPRSFAAVLKSSGSENSLDKQTSPETGQSVDKLPSKVIRGIKENISPENTLTSSTTNTKALTSELTERHIKHQSIVNIVWEVTTPLLKENEPKIDEIKTKSELAPIATIEETCDEAIDRAIKLDFIDDVTCTDERGVSVDSDGKSFEGTTNENERYNRNAANNDMGNIDFGKDALSYIMLNKEFEPNKNNFMQAIIAPQGSLAKELEDAEIKKQMIDLSPELIIDDAREDPEVFTAKEVKGLKSSPVIPERAKLKKSNSLEELLQAAVSKEKDPKAKSIAFKINEIPSTIPCDIPERKTRIRTRSGSSPKSLPESLYKPCPLSKMDSVLMKKKKKVSSLGKMAKDSLLALNMSEEEIADFRRSYKLTSLESLRSLESVSEDANSQSGNSIDSRCRSCLRTSQESLMSLDSINEDCRCTHDSDAGNCGR